ncbi:MAG: hypothetical protein QY332_00490 [Anaerolineales bacterium]|nr:MAG: hypothetical protein QY332_00490 [Anaerolineales bacterium]
MPKGKRISASLKAQIMLEALCEDRSVAQIALENHIHANLICEWKKQALENFVRYYGCSTKLFLIPTTVSRLLNIKFEVANCTA